MQTGDGQEGTAMIDYTQILPNLYIGTFPREAEEIQELKDRCGVTAVLNLQTDEDLDERAIDWRVMEKRYRRMGIEVRRVPLRDFDYEHQRQHLPEAVRVLAGLLTSGHVTYLHCNAGAGRSPLVAMAYLYWYRNLGLKKAIQHVGERRYCAPYEDLLEVSLRKPLADESTVDAE
jgi:protein-tyrosine phosphatase